MSTDNKGRSKLTSLQPREPTINASDHLSR